MKIDNTIKPLTKIQQALNAVKTAQQITDPKPVVQPKSPFDIEKAKKVSPSYISRLGLNKFKSQLQQILKTKAEMGTDEWFQAVYDYQKQNPETKYADGILGPLTYGVMQKQSPSLLPQPVIPTKQDSITQVNNLFEGVKDKGFNLNTFKDKISKIESGGKYNAQSPHSSAAGKYQFIWSMWGRPISEFAGQQITKEQFLGNPELQEKWMDHYTKAYLIPSAERLKSRYPAASQLGYNQLLGLIHFQGEGGAGKYLSTGAVAYTPGNIPVEKYIQKMV